MEVISIIIIAVSLLFYALVSKRLQGTMITAPLVFAALGYVASTAGMQIGGMEETGYSTIHLIAEATLILVLFSDAARIDFGQVRQDHGLPLRMLGMGLPLVMIAGTLVAVVLFPEFTFWEAALLAALLAPTDAALGQTVVSSKVVPSRIRQAINVESGLNDGFALPAVLLFASLASKSGEGTGAWISFFLLQITLGPITGIVIGYAGARLLDSSTRRGWMTESFQGIAILSLAILSYVVAEEVGGNGFIAAFIGGMIFGKTLRHKCDFLFEFMETEGQLLMLITFMIFGVILLPGALASATPMHLVYAALSLTLIRMIPISLSLLGSGVQPATHLFLGWFGPRGLASILFVLLILEETEIMHRHELLTITVLTVALSILLHGMSAAPFASLYGKRCRTMANCAETESVVEMPLRDGSQSTPD